MMLFWIVRELVIGFILCFGELLKIGFRMIGFILCFGGNGKVMVDFMVCYVELC